MLPDQRPTTWTFHTVWAVCDTRTRTPSGQRRRVSYPVSDSMSCRRLAKQHGSETRADQPAAGGHVFPSASRPALPRRQADRVRTGGPCFFTVRPRARTARQTVGTLAGTTFCPRPPLSAQRRPERQPRRHTPSGRRGGELAEALNEGRSVNPGDTQAAARGVHDDRARSTKAGASTPATPRQRPAVSTTIGLAQRRPERQPRRHPSGLARSFRRQGPLNEGRSVNPGDTACWNSASASGAPLNEGRSVNPGDT